MKGIELAKECVTKAVTEGYFGAGEELLGFSFEEDGPNTNAQFASTLLFFGVRLKKAGTVKLVLKLQPGDPAHRDMMNTAIQFYNEGNWWFCLQRENARVLTDITVQDLSNRSMSWSWRTNRGRWNVSYDSTLPSGNYSGSANFTGGQGRTSAIVYDSSGKWSLIGPPMNAPSWNLTYNGEMFGYAPRGNNRFTYWLYTRNVSFPYDPTNQLNNCTPNSTDRVDYQYWWIERKSRQKCPVVVNREVRESPLQWEWFTDFGKWKVQYYWDGDRGIVTSFVFYESRSRNGEKRVMTWQYDEGKLTLAFISVPMSITGEDAWKISVKEGETFGYSPTSVVGQWNFNLYSRNILLQPFVTKDGIINL